MQKKRFATMSIIAAAALSMGLTACVDNEEGDGLKALREGVGDYYQGKGEHERADAHLTEAKIKLETANGAAQEILNAYNDAANKIQLIVDQSNADVTVAGNNVTIIGDTAGIANKILKAQLDEAAKVITSDEALQKLKIAYDGVIAGYKEDLEDTKQKLLVQAQDRADKQNTLDIRIAKAAIEYANKIENAKAEVENTAATDKQNRENQKALNDQTILNTKIANDKTIQEKIKEYDKTNAEYLALIEYNKLAPSAENEKALAEKKEALSDLNLVVAQKLVDLVIKEETNNNAADLYAAEQSIIDTLTSLTDDFVKDIESAQKEYVTALSAYNEVLLTQVSKASELYTLRNDSIAEVKKLKAQYDYVILIKENDLNDAKKGLDDAEKSLKEKKEAYDDDKESLSKRTEYEDAQSHYANAVADKEAADAALKNIKQEAKDFDKTFESNYVYVGGLKNLHEAIVKAQNDLDDANNKVSAKKTELDYAKKVLDEAVANYEEAKKIIDKAIEG